MTIANTLVRSILAHETSKRTRQVQRVWKKILGAKYLCILPEMWWQRLGTGTVSKEEAIVELLNEWERLSRFVVHERSSNWDRDLAKVQKEKEDWKKLLELD